MKARVLIILVTVLVTCTYASNWSSVMYWFTPPTVGLDHTGKSIYIGNVSMDHVIIGDNTLYGIENTPDMINIYNIDHHNNIIKTSVESSGADDILDFKLIYDKLWFLHGYPEKILFSSCTLTLKICEFVSVLDTCQSKSGVIAPSSDKNFINIFYSELGKTSIYFKQIMKPFNDFGKRKTIADYSFEKSIRKISSTSINTNTMALLVCLEDNLPSRYSTLYSVTDIGKLGNPKLQIVTDTLQPDSCDKQFIGIKKGEFDSWLVLNSGGKLGVYDDNGFTPLFIAPPNYRSVHVTQFCDKPCTGGGKCSYDTGCEFFPETTSSIYTTKEISSSHFIPSSESISSSTRDSTIMDTTTIKEDTSQTKPSVSPSTTSSEISSESFTSDDGFPSTKRSTSDEISYTTKMVPSSDISDSISYMGTQTTSETVSFSSGSMITSLPSVYHSTTSETSSENDASSSYMDTATSEDLGCTCFRGHCDGYNCICDENWYGKTCDVPYNFSTTEIDSAKLYATIASASTFGAVSFMAPSSIARITISLQLFFLPLHFNKYLEFVSKEIFPILGYIDLSFDFMIDHPVVGYFQFARGLLQKFLIVFFLASLSFLVLKLTNFRGIKVYGKELHIRLSIWMSIVSIGYVPILKCVCSIPLEFYDSHLELFTLIKYSVPPVFILLLIILILSFRTIYQNLVILLPDGRGIKGIFPCIFSDETEFILVNSKPKGHYSVVDYNFDDSRYETENKCISAIKTSDSKVEELEDNYFPLFGDYVRYQEKTGLRVLAPYFFYISCTHKFFFVWFASILYFDDMAMIWLIGYNAIYIILVFIINPFSTASLFWVEIFKTIILVAELTLLHLLMHDHNILYLLAVTFLPILYIIIFIGSKIIDCSTNDDLY
eukprot:TRINITY_DN5656_c0_g1_i1.p1 TRINITY_DN5656_c0_g1~~TRINITY_DN5656_c0_g1_i1.p1  ORF type:complete len:888 (-),score=114.81 TRINITY_DN5656_c0_g1_i1:80-2743(-)